MRRCWKLETVLELLLAAENAAAGSIVEGSCTAIITRCIGSPVIASRMVTIPRYEIASNTPAHGSKKLQTAAESEQEACCAIC